ncbi:hypothetical protein G7Z17_g9609 [Cylindrodendrum hubeiense]|uniref:Uncharacterized protein n=1 Tax=Cylindrodendrum hubeiense TaxID=595255 RepID=A0A9P5H480_9HYPO|nr:hypothetical protein G7Z17_g9609 [Cylindrodendrum hubeiense]
MPFWEKMKLAAVPRKRRSLGGDDDTATPAMETRLRGWKPLLLSTPVLLGVAALSLILFAIIETLAQLSQTQGGLALSSSQDEMSKYAVISYLYVPIIVAVAFSMLWTWIDLDIKRIQPWMELSKPTGATAEDSILLDYPSDFIAVAPFRAAKRKSSLLAADEQKINMRFLNMAYAIGWLNQSYPAFTTRDYALLPFSVNDDVNDVALSSINRNWTAETTKLWAEFDCTPAIVTKGNTTSKVRPPYDFQGKGCSATVNLDATSFNVTVSYIDNLPDIIYNESSYRCEKDTDELYSALVYWYKKIGYSSDEQPEFNITAMHCDLSFHKQQVLATVTSGDLQPIDSALKPLSTPTNLTSKEIALTPYLRSLPLFQTATFAANEDAVNRQFPEMRAVSSSKNISVSLNPIFRYAIAERGASVDVLEDPTKLQGLVQDVHKQLFALSIKDRLADESQSTNNTATSEFFLTGIVVSRVFSAILEGLLVLVALVASLVLYYTRISASALCTNPSSINHLVDIAHNSPEATKLFRSMDTADEKLLAAGLKGTKFQLTADDLSKRNELITVEEVDATPSDTRRGMPPRCYFKPIKPWVMRRGTGCAFATVLAASIIVLSVLKAKEQKQNGW